MALLHKGAGKSILEPSNFRPLSMLNTVGKVMERLLLERLNEYLDLAEGGRPVNQFGFVTGRSTEDAIAMVLGEARRAAVGVPQSGTSVPHWTSVNAFNTAPWLRIDQALRKKSVPLYLGRILRSYLQRRMLLIGPELTPRSVTCGVPQGSVFGPALWNVLYDGLLKVSLPPGVKLVAFEDDVALLATAQTGALLESILNLALDSV